MATKTRRRTKATTNGSEIVITVTEEELFSVLNGILDNIIVNLREISSTLKNLNDRLERSAKASTNGASYAGRTDL